MSISGGFAVHIFHVVLTMSNLSIIIRIIRRINMICQNIFKDINLIRYLEWTV